MFRLFLRAMWRVPVRMESTADKVLNSITIGAWFLLAAGVAFGGRLINFDVPRPALLIPLGLLLAYSILGGFYDIQQETEKKLADKTDEARNLAEKLAETETNARNRIISPDLSDALSVREITRHGIDTYLCLELHNGGDLELENCRVKLRSLAFYDASGDFGRTGWVLHNSLQDVYLHWSKNEGEPDAKTIAIGGRAVCDLAVEERRVILVVTQDSDLRGRNALHGSYWQYECEIEAKGHRTMRLKGAFTYSPDPEANYIVATLRFAEWTEDDPQRLEL